MPASVAMHMIIGDSQTVTYSFGSLRNLRLSQQMKPRSTYLAPKNEGHCPLKASRGTPCMDTDFVCLLQLKARRRKLRRRRRRRS